VVWLSAMGMERILPLVSSRRQHFFHAEKINSGHRLWGQSLGSHLFQHEILDHCEQGVGMAPSVIGVVGIDRHASNRMAVTTRSRCRRRLKRSPIPFIQPYLRCSKACPWAAVVASTMVASASIQGPITVPHMVQGARRIRGWRQIRLTFPAFARV
jgi:hypothetical protein